MGERSGVTPTAQSREWLEPMQDVQDEPITLTDECPDGQGGLRNEHAHDRRIVMPEAKERITEEVPHQSEPQPSRPSSYRPKIPRIRWRRLVRRAFAALGIVAAVVSLILFAD